MISVRWHSTLYLVAWCAGAAIGFFGLMLTLVANGINIRPPWLQFLVLASGGLLGMYAARLIFFKLIPVRCPKCAAPAHARYADDREIVYDCKSCGHTALSGIADSDVTLDGSE